MQIGILLLTLGAYGLAIWLWVRDRTPNYLVALLAGNLGSLASPLWQTLYRFSYDPNLTPLFTLFGQPLPRLVFLGAWASILPPLVVFYLYRHDWWFPGWFPGYKTGLLTFALFVVYHLTFESIGVRSGWWRYNTSNGLPLGLQITLLSALMNGLVSLGLLSLLLLTRRYAWLSLSLLLPMPLVLNLFVNGLLGAPLYTALLLQARMMQTQNWAGVIGMVGTLGLLCWAAHIGASSIEGQRAGQHA